MAANTVTTKRATPTRLVLLVVASGTNAGGTEDITAATILAAMKAGPLKNLWTHPGKKAFAGVAAADAAAPTQAELRAALLEGPRCRITTRCRKSPAVTTAKVEIPAVDVNVDGTTASQAKITYTASEDAAQELYIELEYLGGSAA